MAACIASSMEQRHPGHVPEQHWRGIALPGQVAITMSAITTLPGDEWRRPDYFAHLPARLHDDKLPGFIRELVRSVAQQYQVPPDLPLLIVLSVIAAATRGQIKIAIRPGWSEPLSLYTAPLLSSGNRKSSTVAWLLKPLHDAEKEALSAALPEYRRAQSNARIAAEALSRAERDALKGSPDALADLEAARDRDAAAHAAVKPLPVFLIDDATPEAIGKALADQGSIAAISAEGGIIGILTGERYNNGSANLDAVLKAHSGEPLRIDRKGSEPIHCDDPHLVISIAAQPDVLREMQGSREMKARGFLSRFLIVMPDSLLGQRISNPPPIPEGHREAWDQIVHSIIGSTPREMQFDADAAAVIERLWERSEYEWQPQHDDEYLRGFISKLAGSIARIAALFTLAADPHATRVEAWAARDAAVLADWFYSHAVAVVHRRTPSPAEQVLDWLAMQMRKHVGDVGDVFLVSKRQVQQALKQRTWVKYGDRIKGAQAVDAALTELASHGWIRAVDVTNGERRTRSEAWQCHPQLLSHYAQMREQSM